MEGVKHDDILHWCKEQLPNACLKKIKSTTGIKKIMERKEADENDATIKLNLGCLPAR